MFLTSHHAVRAYKICTETLEMIQNIQNTRREALQSSSDRSRAEELMDAGIVDIYALCLFVYVCVCVCVCVSVCACVRARVCV